VISKERALTQKEHILDIFNHLTFVYDKEMLMTPSQIETQWINLERGRKYFPPLPSIRARMTELTDAGKLVKTDIMKEGKYGDSEHCWKLNKESKQLSLI